jgi:DNA-binding CsgD family transcriptional regulator
MGGDTRERRPAGSAAPLIEREKELDAIDAALDATRASEGRLLLVEGHAGIGKSGLIAAAANRAESAGMTVLRAQGTDLERDHSFGVVLQLFEPVMAREDEDGRRDLLAGAAALARPLFEDHAGTAASPEEVFSLLHGLHWLTSNLAERRPLLIAADDAHWTDRSTLRFFLYLAQRLPDLPAVLITAARAGEPGAPEDLLRQLRTHRATETLRPAPLSRQGVGTVVRERLPGAEGEFVDACLTVTEGNPYLLRELLADLGDRGVAPTNANAREVGRLAPDSVLDAALVRLTRLPTGSAALARAAAVLGDDATFGRAAALAQLEPDVAAPVADALAAAEILRPGEPLAFVHPLLHSAIYLDLPSAERAQAHLRAAKLLDEAGASAETVAAHLLLAPAAGDPWAVERLRTAAALSLARGAAESAVRYLVRALEELPSSDARAVLLVELGEAEALTGTTGGIERLHQALDLVDDPRRRAEVLERLGWMVQQTGDMRVATETFARGVAELEAVGEESAGDAQLTRLRTAHLGAALLTPGASDEAHAQLRQVIESPNTELPERQLGLISAAALHLMFNSERHETVIALSKRVWGDGSLLVQEGPNSPAVWHVVGCLSWSDAFDEAEAVIEAALDAARREGRIVTVALGLYSRSWPGYWRGDIHGAAADAQAAVEAWSGEFTMYLPVAAYWLALSLLELGDVDGAAAAVDYPDAPERWGESNQYGPLLVAQGLVRMARGEQAEAVDLLERAGGSVAGSVIANPALLPWRSFLALARLSAGDRDGAREIAREELELARRFGAARAIGIALRAAGLAEGGTHGVAALEDSVRELRRSPAKLELARSLVELGASLRRQGHRAAARDPLREALEMTSRFGALALTRRARDELRASGARPRSEEVAGVHALTPSELRVAELAASGMTNREIAQSLFVTVKAVQFHLRNTYRKLEVGSREELPAALSRTRP